MKIAERTIVTPEGWDGPKPWKTNFAKWPQTCLVIHTTCQDAAGEPLRIGVGVVHTPMGDLVRVIYAEGNEKEALALAETHGAHAMPLQDFARRFVNHYVEKGSAIAGWLLGVDFSRMAVRWSEKDADHFTIYLASRPPKKGEPNSRYPLFPNGEVRDSIVFPVRVKPLDGQRTLLSFSAIKFKKDGKWVTEYPKGPPLDLRVLAEQAFGRDFGEDDLPEVCSLFGVAYPPEGDLVEQTLVLTKLYDAIIDAHFSLGLPILPSEVRGHGSYAKALLAARGIDRAPEQLSEDADRAMRALHGGEGFPYVYRYPIPSARLDFGGCHQVIAALAEAWRMERAERIVTRQMTGEEATTEAERIPAAFKEWRSFGGSAPPKDDWHSLLTTVFEIDPHGDVLPHHPSGKKDDVMRVGEVTASSEPLLRSGFDVVRSILRTGKTPHILQAHRYVAEGDRAPGSPDPFFELWSNRKRLETDPASIPANERDRRDGWAKMTANPAASGLPIESHDRRARKRERVLVGDDGDPIPAPGQTVEQRGPFHNPIIAVGVNAGARLILYLLTSLIEEHGGTIVRTNIDAVDVLASREEDRTVFVPGLGMRKALSYREIDEIRWKMDELLGELGDLPPGPRRVMMTPITTKFPEQMEASWVSASTELPERIDVLWADVFEPSMPVSVPEPRFLKLDPACEPRASRFRLSDPYTYAIGSNSHAMFYIRHRGPHVENRRRENGTKYPVLIGDYVPDGIEIADYTRHRLVQYVDRDGWEKEVWENTLTDLPWDEIIGPNEIEKKPLPFADAAQLALVRATRMADVRAIPGMRPMARMISTTPLAWGGMGRKHPVAAYHESFGSFSASADWHNWTAGDSLTIVPIDEWDGDADRPDVVPASTMGAFVRRFRESVPKRAVTPDGEPLTRKTVGAIYPAPIIVTGIDRVGKQGPKFADQGTEGSGLPIQGTTTYREAHLIEDVLAFLRRRAQLIGASQLIGEAADDGIAERTVKRALAERKYRPHKDTTKALTRLAERLAEAEGLSIEESLLTEQTPRVCASCGAPLPNGSRKWCNPSCRHRAYRARTMESAR